MAVHNRNQLFKTEQPPYAIKRVRLRAAPVTIQVHFFLLHQTCPVGLALRTKIAAMVLSRETAIISRSACFTW